MADAEFLAVHYPKFATVLVGGVGVIGTGSNTVTLSTLGVDNTTAGMFATIYTAGTNGGIVDSLMISTSDGAAVNVLLWIMDGSTIIPLGIVNIPLSSGMSATAPNIDALAGAGTTLTGLAINSNGKRYLQMKAGQILKAGVLAQMSANKQVWIRYSGLEFSS